MIRKTIRIGIVLLIFLSICILSSCQKFETDDGGLSQHNTTDNAGMPPFNQTDPTPSISLSLLEDIKCTHFVALDGKDGNLGTEAEPWETFQHVSDVATPGDVVCFREGIYQTQDIHISKSGETNKAISFVAFPGEHPILDGGGTANELVVLESGVSNIRISGFGIQNFGIWGVFLTGENNAIYLDHLTILGGETSIRFTYGESTEGPALEGPVENIVLEDSFISGSQYSAVDCTPGPCNYVNFRRLEVYNTGLTGESFYGSDGIEFARGHHIVVEDCYVHDNGGGWH